MKKTYISFFIFVLLLAFVSFILGRFSASSDTTEFSILPTPVPTPFARYTIPSLVNNYNQVITDFKIVNPIKEEKEFTSFEFELIFDPTFENKQTKKVSGFINIPKGEGVFPLIVMVRGYVDPHIYTTGVGTKNAAEYFTKNGFITVSPDFLGYAQSDSEAGNIFESRFQTYTTLLSLLNAIKSLGFANAVPNKWDQKNIYMWAHSNGGQIALTALSVTGEVIPTVLWAPVTKPFPYSVLYYTDESIDGGKLIRRELSKFENVYNTDLYSVTNYLNQITAPIEFEQGTADDAVPFVWTRSIANILKKQGLEIIYNEYKGSDHNLRPAWNAVVERNLEFYRKYLK